jgi:hypothetical protein
MSEIIEGKTSNLERKEDRLKRLKKYSASSSKCEKSIHDKSQQGET